MTSRKNENCGAMFPLKTVFDVTQKGEAVDKYTFRNSKGMEVDVITFGCYITSIRIPDKEGNLIDVVLGFDKLSVYESAANRYFGAVVGRVANRINKGQFTLNGNSYQLNTNNGPNHLHGGNRGWDKNVWTAEVLSNNVLKLIHISEDGDENYPGKVTAIVEYSLTEACELKLSYKATVEGKSTPINMTSHSYFNLAGEGSGTIHDHEVTIFANKFIPTNQDLIPTGELADVTGTPYDLRNPCLLKDALFTVPGGGFDNTFCVQGAPGIRLAVRVSHCSSGRVMEVYTDQPGVQFYTGNFLDVSAIGKQGHSYPKHSALCLETQNYPDAVNQPNFPDSILHPGNVYKHYCCYKFMF